MYLGAVLRGALRGAKLGFLVAEGWLYVDYPRRWALWLWGKRVLGALLGRHASVELGKQVAGVREATGDWFALMVSAGLVADRVGCLFHGCCGGGACAWVPGGVWPAAWVELAFNAAALGVLAMLKPRGVQRGQRSHLYWLAYGALRLVHAPLRATPKLGDAGPAAWVSLYQGLARGLLALGSWGYARRRSARAYASAMDLATAR